MIYICFLCKNPKSIEYLEFINSLSDKYYKIFLCIDDNTYNYIYHEDFKNINIIQIDNDECNASGYKGLVSYFKNRGCSKDKALYYFNNYDIKYHYLWLIEDDTFLPNKDIIKNIDNKYKLYDFLSPPLYTVDGCWYWINVINEQFELLKLEYTKYRKLFNYKKYNSRRLSKCMTCCIRLSRNYMITVDEFTNYYNTLFMDEIFFINISIINNMFMKSIPELKYIKYKESILDDSKINFLYHPMKDFERQKKIRCNNI